MIRLLYTYEGDSDKGRRCIDSERDRKTVRDKKRDRERRTGGKTGRETERLGKGRTN